MLTPQQITNVENTLRHSLRTKFQHYNPEPAVMPFHTRLLGKDRMALFSFIHSLNTNFGTSIFEPVAKSLAELLFDDEQAMIRFDMSEFKEEHSAALLYGAPPGYVGYEEGGLLVTKIRQKPYSVVLFDEIEKAHHSVYDVFLQMMDEGKIHDRLGREGDFSNAIIIFTSNIGSAWIREQFNAGKPPRSNELIEVMADTFRPEFLGRLTEVVPFAPISEEMAQAIFKLHFTRLQRQLQEQKDIHIELGEEALIYLSAKGFSEQYGARPIAGVIRTYLKKSISRLIVEESLRSGDCVRVDYRDHDLVWTAL